MFPVHKRLGIDLLLTNLMIVKTTVFFYHIWNEHSGFLTSLVSPIMIKSQNLGPYFAHGTPLSPRTNRVFGVLS